MLHKVLGRCLLWIKHKQKVTSKAQSGHNGVLMCTLLKRKMSDWTPYGLLDLKDTTQNSKYTLNCSTVLVGTLKQTQMFYVLCWETNLCYSYMHIKLEKRKCYITEDLHTFTLTTVAHLYTSHCQNVAEIKGIHQ